VEQHDSLQVDLDGSQHPVTVMSRQEWVSCNGHGVY
jgi:hypothetical protein